LWIEVETRERCYPPTPLISEEPETVSPYPLSAGGKRTADIGWRF